MVLVRKKDHSWRLCKDYRRLNAVTRKDAYPFPRINNSLDALAGSMYFSTLNLVSGYLQGKVSFCDARRVVAMEGVTIRPHLSSRHI